MNIPQNNWHKINELFVIFLAASVGLLTSTVTVFYVVLIGTAIKEILFGKMLKSITENGIFVIASVSTIIFSGILLSNSSIAVSVSSIGSYILLLLLGMSYQQSKSSEWLLSGLLQIRDFVVLASILSLIIEIILGYRFVTDGSSPPFTLTVILDRSSYRVRGIFGHAIVFAQILIISLIINTKIEKNNIKRIAFNTLFLLLIFFSKTRAAWILIGLIAASVGFKHIIDKDNHNWQIIALSLPIVLLIICYLSHNGYINDIINRFMQLSSDVSFSQRFGAIIYMVSDFLSKPYLWLFGSGFGASSNQISQYTVEIEGFSTVDNGYITLLYEYGLIGLCLFCIMMITALRNTARCGRSDVRVLFGIVVVSLVEMIFYCELGWWVPTAIWLLAAGYLFSLTKASKAASSEGGDEVCVW